MKIYILNVDRRSQPVRQGFAYPRHNKDFGVEQDFLNFLGRNRSLIADKPEEADWHYLPIFWTRWHLNHDYAQQGIEELQQIVDAALIDDARTFTICQYDDGPLVNLGRTFQFLASRKTEVGIDIPLLCCQQHRKPWLNLKKRYLASFVGRLDTHPIRIDMAAAIQGRSDASVLDGDLGTRVFVRRVLQSYIALAPRGYGGSSFRFFEAMQLGVVPLLLGDIDTRPFKRFLPWEDVSIYVKDVAHLNSVLYGIAKKDLTDMGKHAAMLYREHLTYQNWCGYVIRELQGD